MNGSLLPPEEYEWSGRSRSRQHRSPEHCARTSVVNPSTATAMTLVSSAICRRDFVMVIPPLGELDTRRRKSTSKRPKMAPRQCTLLQEAPRHPSAPSHRREAIGMLGCAREQKMSLPTGRGSVRVGSWVLIP